MRRVSSGNESGKDDIADCRTADCHCVESNGVSVFWSIFYRTKSDVHEG